MILSADCGALADTLPSVQHDPASHPSAPARRADLAGGCGALLDPAPAAYETPFPRVRRSERLGHTYASGFRRHDATEEP